MEKEGPKFGTLAEVMGRIWELYVVKGASNESTRRHLRKMNAFSETEIFHLMEKLQQGRAHK